MGFRCEFSEVCSNIGYIKAANILDKLYEYGKLESDLTHKQKLSYNNKKDLMES